MLVACCMESSLYASVLSVTSVIGIFRMNAIACEISCQILNLFSFGYATESMPTSRIPRKIEGKIFVFRAIPLAFPHTLIAPP